MRLPLILIVACLVPLSSFAEEQMVKKRVVVTDGEDLDGRITEIIETVESAMGEDGNVRVIVKRLGDGEMDVDVEEKVSVAGRGRARHMAPHGTHGPRGHHRSHGQSKMSEGAAECVLKHIRNAQSDQAAKAVVNACKTLNPAPVE